MMNTDTKHLNDWNRYTQLENITQRAAKLATLNRLIHAGIIHEMEQTEPDAIELENALDELDRLNQTLTDDIDRLQADYLQALRAEP